MDGKAEGDYKIFIVKTWNSTFETCEWMSFSLAFDVGMHSFLRTLLFKRHNSALVCLSCSLTFSELKYYHFYTMVTLLPYFSIPCLCSRNGPHSGMPFSRPRPNKQRIHCTTLRTKWHFHSERSALLNFTKNWVVFAPQFSIK